MMNNENNGVTLDDVVREERPLFKDFLMIFSVIGVFVVVMLGFYLFSEQVDSNVLGSPEQFGQFGDFFGGLINPLVGICSLGLIMWTITIQREILRVTRRELDLTRSELIK